MARYTKVLKSLAHNAVGNKRIEAAAPASANYYVTGASLNNATDVLTLAVKGASDVTVDLSHLAGGGATTPGGSNTQVQYNNGGAFAGSANMTFNGTTLSVGGLAVNGTSTFSDHITIAENKELRFDSADTFIKADTDTDEDLMIHADDDIFLVADDDVFIQNETNGTYVAFDGANERVGIGTIAPAYALDVSGAVDVRLGSGLGTDVMIAGTNHGITRQSNSIKLYNNAKNAYFGVRDSATGFVQISGTNVGIGTMSPGYPLHVSGAATQEVRVQSSDSGAYSRIQLRSATDGYAQFNMGDSGADAAGGLVYTHSTDTLNIRAANSNIMNVTSAGVGIGTSSPQQKLHVEGTFRFRDANSSSQRLEGFGQNDNFVLSVSGTDALGLQGGTPGVRFLDSAANAHLTITESGTSAAQFSAASAVPVCVMKEDVGIIMDDNQGIRNHVQSLSNFMVDAGTGINTVDLQGYSKIQNILLDPQYGGGGLPTNLDVKLPVGVAGMEFIVTLGVTSLNLGSLTLRLVANGSDVIYNAANAVSNITFTKNVGESIHLICFETNKWSVVAHT